MATTFSKNRGAALAQEVAEYITAHPEEWGQETWGVVSPCGTRMCYAGTASFLTGKATWKRYRDNTGGYKGLGSCLVVKDGRSFEEAGAELLELTRLQADSLFYNMMSDRDGANNLRIMWHTVADLYPEGAITIPEEYR